ncbi:MAG: hypothetical protein IIY19_03840, partial [Lachnospiraceae bacterium]|nr:hypothetical protein [Lachnospiraceae bacterium]
WCGQYSDDSTITSEETDYFRHGTGIPGARKVDNSSGSWSNLELYASGLNAFKGNYWPCVLIALLQSIGPAIFIIWFQGGTIISIVHGESVDLLVFTIVPALMAILRILVFNPLNVGCSRFFVQNAFSAKPGRRRSPSLVLCA